VPTRCRIGGTASVAGPGRAAKPVSKTSTA
jgi:hypothetical protein